jgi:diguanylate cyclase (GGDEF)-like protein
MPVTTWPQGLNGRSMPLDVPTLITVSIFITVVLGLLLLFAWIQDPSIQALGWWGAAYLLGGLSGMLLGLRGLLGTTVSVDLASALLFIACGLSWNAARMFDARQVRPFAMVAGAVIWLLACQSPVFSGSEIGRIVVSSFIISNYTLLTAYELWNGRNERLFSRWPAVIVLTLHGLVFPSMIPLTMVLPVQRSGIASYSWLGLLALETLFYAIATAFIVLEMAKERHKTAASIDPLTGMFNRRAFVDSAGRIVGREANARCAVAVLMFDVDHFKSINDRFGHQFGDRVLKLFATTACANLRTSDLIGRLGGEEFAAILPASNLESAWAVAERVRGAFEAAAVEVEGRPVCATVSVGAAVTTDPRCELESLLSNADQALYLAKKSGRNRVVLELRAHAAELPPNQAARAPVARSNSAALPLQ